VNVLVLSAAAKVLLVRAFQEAAGPRGGQVFAADIAADNAALFEADGAFLLPRSDDPDFGAALAQACRVRSISLVVPTRDGELAPLAALRPSLAEEGVTGLVAAREALEICQDKRRFSETCRANGFETPRTYAPGEPPERFPVFVRPTRGAGGAGARRVDHPAELPGGEDHLVQELDKTPEFTIDVLMDLAGRPLQAVARLRLVVRAGEAVKSQVVDAPELTHQALQLCEILGLVGHNVLQAFYEPGRPPRFIEVNPRFGGASNLAIRAGLASPDRILQMLAGEREAAAAPREIAYGLMMLRHAEDRFVMPADLAAVAR
jgi:carbamoyl-phosphate synthase large subunit